MAYYYGGGQSTVSSAFAPPSPTNYDISLIVEPAANGTGGLYLGNIAAATNNTMLKALNIKSMLTSAVEANFTPDPSVTPNYLKIAALDHPDYPLEQHFEEATQFIHQSLPVSNVLVHCMAGVSRSVTFVLAYLMKHRRMKLDDAFQVVLNNRTISNPNPGFMTQLRIYETKIKQWWKMDDKRKKKLLKQMKNHHPVLMFGQQPTTYSEQNIDLVVSSKGSNITERQNRPLSGRQQMIQSSPAALRSSIVNNTAVDTTALTTSISNPKIVTAKNLYLSNQNLKTSITPAISETKIPSQSEIQAQIASTNSMLSKVSTPLTKSTVSDRGVLTPQPPQVSPFKVPPAVAPQQYVQPYAQYGNTPYYNAYYTQQLNQAQKPNYAPQYYTQNGYRPYGGYH